MNSCAASCGTCSRKGSCAFATSVSWPTADAPLFCPSAFNCSAHHKAYPSGERLPSLTQTVFGDAPSVADRWWSSKGSPPQNSNCVPHHWSMPRHEKFSPTRIFRASYARSARVSLVTNQNSSPCFLTPLAHALFHLRSFLFSTLLLHHSTSRANHANGPKH